MKGGRDQYPGTFIAPRTTRPSLLAGLRVRDPDKWELFMRVYLPWVYRKALSKTGDEHLAAEIAQDVVLGAMQGLRRFECDGREASFRRWLGTIARRQVADHFRRMRTRWVSLPEDDLPCRLPAPDSEETVPDDESSISAPPRGEMARAGFEILQQRFEPTTIEAARLAVVEGLSAAVVADRLGISKAAVHVAVSRVRKALRDLLEGPPPACGGETG